MTETKDKKASFADLNSVQIQCSAALIGNGPIHKILPDEKVWTHDDDLQKAGTDHVLKVG